MNEQSFGVLGDLEVVELLADEPELLAIADAVAATTPMRGARTYPRSSKRHRISRLARQRRRWLVFAVSLAAVVAAAPALALPAVRHLVGLDTTTPLPPAPYVTAKVTGEWFHKPDPYALPTVTIAFTVGRPGKPPGAGIRTGASFLVFLIGNDVSEPLAYAAATGSRGYYHATVHVPKGGIRLIRIGGFLNAFPSPADGGKFWIPVKVAATGNV